MTRPDNIILELRPDEFYLIVHALHAMIDSNIEVDTDDVVAAEILVEQLEQREGLS